MGTDLADRLDRDGFALASGMVSPREIAFLIVAIGDSGRHAIRNLLEVVPEVANFARSEAVRGLIEPILGADSFAVRGLFFDKTPGANWKVGWHQDTTIAVRDRVESEGFGPWSEKAGIVHVRPPAAILESMLTLRIHLDPCGAENGPLRAIPGSHRLGRLDPGKFRLQLDSSPVLLADAGDILLMRPLLFHASSAASKPEHRRVIHLEFASISLPGGLEWHGRW